MQSVLFLLLTNFTVSLSEFVNDIKNILVTNYQIVKTQSVMEVVI